MLTLGMAAWRCLCLVGLTFTVTPDYAGGATGEIAGLMQINVRIPANLAPGTTVPVTVQAPGYASSQPGVTIAIGN